MLNFALHRVVASCCLNDLWSMLIVAEGFLCINTGSFTISPTAWHTSVLSMGESVRNFCFDYRGNYNMMCAYVCGIFHSSVAARLL